METQLIGKVSSIVYTNSDNFFTVAKFEAENIGSVTVKGILPELEVGDKLKLDGKWVEHNIYGKQFSISKFELLPLDSVESIYNYLSSGVLTGVGPSTAKKIIDKFGVKAIDILENDPQQYLEIEGIGLKKLDKIMTSHRKNINFKNIIMELSNYNISSNLCIKLYDKYREKTLDVLFENPYRVCKEINGIGFKIADDIALKLGVGLESLERKEEAIKYILLQASYSGDSYTLFYRLFNELQKFVNIPDTLELYNILMGLYAKKEIVLSEDFKEDYSDLKIYLYKYALAETRIASRLYDIASFDGNENIDDKKLNSIIESVKSKKEFSFSDEQISCCKMAANNNVILITGGPGTGKTTTLSIIIEMFLAMHLNIKLCAPTGKAAKRMTYTTGIPAMTIHRLLEANKEIGNDEFISARDSENPIKADVIIIDESSMIDLLLMDRLLDAVKNGTKLIFVGDKDQLPSVGTGKVFNDLIDCGKLKCVRLTKIFRQSQESNIVTNAHRINKGKMPLGNDKDKDFFIIRCYKKEDILKLVPDLIIKRLPNYYGLSSDEIQVITPMKKSQIGTESLNILLQETLNPKTPEKNQCKIGNRIFREGDKIIHIRNNYEKIWVCGDEKGTGVFNGDTGIITSIYTNEQKLTVCFEDDKIVDYEFSELNEIELSYAITVHKSQGSEYPCVILPIFGISPLLQTRKILYTAITRAKKLLVIITNEKTLKNMINNVFVEERKTTLKEKINMISDIKLYLGEKNETQS